MKKLTLSFVLILSACGGGKLRRAPAGLPQPLAQERARTLRDVRYDLDLNLADRIEGEMTVKFTYNGQGKDVVLDFQAPQENLLAVDRKFHFENGHIIVPVTKGVNSITLRFVSPETSLHRGKDTLYSLFVPDRAKEAFPVFDQPDVKARWRLSLRLPQGWKAVSNAAPQHVYPSSVTFRETRPIPSYLFAFAAGKFSVEKAVRGKRTMRIYHVERNRAKFRRNAKRIFDLHAKSLDWLESYTDIKYPWGKLDIILLPSFQYNGMEHPGAIYYRAESLLLENKPTQEDRLDRADTIAHECAHQWFGNLVTMRWFSDVWTKESFAGFMAGKITQPQFPEIDHDLLFVIGHMKRAYNVDRSAGTHPLYQPLANLDEAGTLYGSLIYHKSPFVLRQLEAVMGDEAFRQGLRAVLKQYAFKNASWRQMIAVLDQYTPEDLAYFSKMWVETAGRPTLTAHWETKNEEIVELAIEQSGGIWPQKLQVFLPPRTFLPVQLTGKRTVVPKAAGRVAPGFVLANGKGWGYGNFRFDKRSAAHALPTPPRVATPLARGIMWNMLFDNVMEGGDPERFVEDVVEALRKETNELVLSELVGKSGMLQTVFWRFLTPPQMRAASPRIEQALWRRIASKKEGTSLKRLLFNAYMDLSFTPEATDGLADVALRSRGFEAASGLQLSDRDRVSLSLAISLRAHSKEAEIYASTYKSVKDTNLRDKFAFLHRAASPDAGVRHALYQDLFKYDNRRKEPWVREALRYMHHPLRAPDAIRYIKAQLELLPEIQRTGDIFFPSMWANGLLSGHNSAAAVAAVNSYLKTHPELPKKLRLKLLQAADVMRRAHKHLKSVEVDY
jgi:aminopeptidase N